MTKYVRINDLTFDLLYVGMNVIVISNKLPGRITHLSNEKVIIIWEYDSGILQSICYPINTQGNLRIHPNIGVTFNKCKRLNKIWIETGSSIYRDRRLVQDL